MSTREALHSSNSVEWYSPPNIVEPARRCLGGIGLDPASCTLANLIVQAAKFYTEVDDGLVQPWNAPWFCNPPYGIGITGKWTLRAQQAAYAEAPGILLVNAMTAQRWFQDLWQYPICFPKKRIQFLETVTQREDRFIAQLLKNKPFIRDAVEDRQDLLSMIPVYKGVTYANGQLVRGPQPTHANAIVYMGSNAEAFEREFSDIGHITWPGARDLNYKMLVGCNRPCASQP